MSRPATLLRASFLALAATASAVTYNDPNPVTGVDLVINTSLPSVNIAQGVTISASGIATSYAVHFVNPGAAITVDKVVIAGTAYSAWDAGVTNRQQNVIGHLILTPTGRIHSDGWYGFYNEWNNGTFTTITNLGSISSILNEGVFGTLNNFQNTASADGRLHYDGNLPSSYNVVIRGAACGQVRFGGDGSLTFGIYGGDPENGIAASTPRTGTYQDVMTNLGSGQIANPRVGGVILGTYEGSVWKLVDTTYRAGSEFDWDLHVLNYGLDLAEPQRAVLERRGELLRIALDHDCIRFGATDWGFSVKGRYSNAEDNGEAAAVLTVAKRLSPNLRVGGFLDRRGSERDVGGVMLQAGAPMAGLFAVYSGGADGTGLQARLAGASEHADATITHANLFGIAANASGQAAVNSYGLAHRLGWGFGLGEGSVLTPYLGIRYTRAQRDGYREGRDGGQVADPLAFAAYGERRTTASFGLDLAAVASRSVGYHVGIGYDRDVSFHRDTFALSSAELGDSAYASPAKPRRGDWNASAGIGLDLENGRTLTLDGIGSQTDYTDNPEFSVMLGYHVRL